MRFCASRLALPPVLARLLPDDIAEKLHEADVPLACSTICRSLLQLANTCGIDPN